MFLVDAVNPIYGEAPYTVGSGECGKSGGSIHLTPEYLAGVNSGSNDAVFGPHGNTSVKHASVYKKSTDYLYYSQYLCE